MFAPLKHFCQYCQHLPDFLHLSKTYKLNFAQLSALTLYLHSLSVRSYNCILQITNQS